MKFEIRKYYSTYFTMYIKADSEEEAYKKSKKEPINENEILTNLEDWEDADEIERIEYSENKE